jgi:AraC-like DNA-binding protein
MSTCDGASVGGRSAVLQKRVGVMGDRLKRLHPSGVLDLRAGERWFDAAQYRPAPELAELVEHYWRVRWDVRGHEPYVQHTLSNAAVHLCIERDDCRIQGVVTGRFNRLLEGRGWVFGVKFRPAGFHPFLRSTLAALADRSLPVGAVFGPDGETFVTRVLGLDDEARMVEAADAFLGERRPPPDPVVAQVNRIVALIVRDRRITRVDQLAELTGVGKRTLQRLFGEYVGVSPKWVIQRYRLHEAAERLDAGQEVGLAELALDLGYFDQAHFVRDFKAMVGRPPGAYARGARR